MKLYFLGLFIILSSFLLGQNYLPYYQLCNEGDQQAYLKNYQRALTKYQEAFELVDYVHAYKLEQAAAVAAKVKNFKLTAHFARQALKNGLPERFLNRKIFKKFRQSKEYQSLEKQIPKLKKEHLSSINLSYQQAVDSLHFVDQRIVRKNLAIKGNYQIDESTLPQNRYDLDDSIFQHLLDLIDEYGFPSEKNIGFEGYQNSWVILHHNVRLEKNAAYLSILKEAVFSGAYMPREYALMYDQSLILKEEKPFFVPTHKDLSKEEIAFFDKRRTKHGLKPLESLEINSNGNVARIKKKW